MDRKLVILYLSTLILMFSCMGFRDTQHREKFDDLNARLDSLERLSDESAEAILKYIDASIYKKDAQLYIMNKMHGNKDIHEALADSFRIDCLKFKLKEK